AANYEIGTHRVSKTKSRAKVVVVQAGNIPMLRVSVNQSPFQVGQSGYLKRGGRIGIEIVHMIEPFPTRQADVVAEPDIQSKFVCRSKIVLDVTGILKTLRGRPGSYLVTAASSDTHQKTRHRISAAGLGELRSAGEAEAECPGCGVRLKKTNPAKTPFPSEF